MAYHDWNGNGEKDKIDDNIAYNYMKSNSGGGAKSRKAVKKSTVLVVIAVVLCLAYAFLMPAFTETDTQELWKGATYTEHAQIGQGANRFSLEIIVGGNSVVLLVNSDKATVGEALLEHNIISGEQGPYGLYIKSVNGITADYDTDKSYWAFLKNGGSVQTGVDGELIENGAHYALVYTK